MNGPTIEEAARQGAQEAIAMQGNQQHWQNTILAILGVVSLAGTALFFIIDSRIDAKNQPLRERDIKHSAAMDAVQKEVTELKDETKEFFMEIKKDMDELKTLMMERGSNP